MIDTDVPDTDDDWSPHEMALAWSCGLRLLLCYLFNDDDPIEAMKTSEEFIVNDLIADDPDGWRRSPSRWTFGARRTHSPLNARIRTGQLAVALSVIFPRAVIAEF